MKANVPQQVKSIREQIIGDVGSENKQNEEMSQDLKEMQDHFNQFLADLNKKEEIKSNRNDSYEEQLFVNFDAMMQKQGDKWTQKVLGEIKSLQMKADTLRNVILINLEEAQKRVEQQNSNLVNKLKFKMKSLPSTKSNIGMAEINKC